MCKGGVDLFAGDNYCGNGTAPKYDPACLNYLEIQLVASWVGNGKLGLRWAWMALRFPYSTSTAGIGAYRLYNIMHLEF